MTTIVYKDGVIACDSRQTEYDRIINDSANKIEIYRDAIFVFAGNVDTIQECVKYFFDEISSFTRNSGTCSGLCYYNTDLIKLGYNEDNGYWQQIWDKNVPYTLGSGRDHAMTAIDLGCSPKEAVKMAMKRDSSSGGRIREIKLW